MSRRSLDFFCCNCGHSEHSSKIAITIALQVAAREWQCPNCRLREGIVTEGEDRYSKRGRWHGALPKPRRPLRERRTRPRFPRVDAAVPARQPRKHIAREQRISACAGSHWILIKCPRCKHEMHWDPLSLVENLGRDYALERLPTHATCWKCRTRPCLVSLKDVEQEAMPRPRGFRRR